jgi:hypothetical protein
MNTTCGINLELYKIKESLLKGINPLNQIKENIDKLSSEEIYNILLSTDNIVTSQLVYGKDLKIDNRLLDSDGKVSRYVFKDTNQVAFTKRATDTGKLSDVKTFNKTNVDSRSRTPDSLIQANGGTVIHAISESIMEELIAFDTSGLIGKTEKKIKPSKEISKENLISNDNYNQLYLVVKDIFEQIKEKQNKINPKEKAFIMTEKFLFSAEMGTTLDVMYLLSNKKVGVFDYKSITPYFEHLDKNKNISSVNWIPANKLRAMSSQMANIDSILKKELGFEVESIRVVPIQTEYESKNEKNLESGNRLTGKLTTIKAGKRSSEHLSQIPMIVEKFENEKLNETLEKLLILKNNILADLNSTNSPKKRIVLTAKLNKIQNQINSIQVDKDIQKIYEYFKELVNRYSYYKDGSYSLKNLDEEFIEKTIDEEVIKEKNPDYMSLEELKELRRSLVTLGSIIASTEEFMKELDIKDKEKYNYLRKIEAEITKRSQVMISDLNQRLLHRVLTSQQITELKDSYSLGSLGGLFSRPSEQSNVIIQEYHRLTSQARDKKRLSVQSFEKELKSVLLPLQQWGKQKGKKGFSVFEDLINNSTSNLHNALTPEFFKMLNNLKSIKNSKNREKLNKSKEELLKFYKIKDNADTIYKNMRDSYIRNENPSEEDLKKWEDKWNKKSDYVILDKINIYYTLDYEKIPNTYFTKEYLYIKSQKELLDFYNFWEKNMYKFLHILEVYGDSHYANFIPWIKAKMTEKIIKDGISGFTKEMKESMSLSLGVQYSTEDTTTGDKFVEGKINPETGEVQRTIPRFFLNPIYNNEGKVDSSLKSFDLGKSILIFAEMAYNYKYMSEIEEVLDTLKEVSLMDEAGLIAEDINTKFPGGSIHRLKGVKNEIYDYIDKMIKYNVYGMHYDMDGKTSAYTRALFEVDKYNKKRLFALNLNSAIKAQTASRLMLFYEGIKSIYFTKKMSADAFDMQVKMMKDVAQNKNSKELELTRFFATYSDNLTPDRIANISVDPTQKMFGMATEDLINFLGRGDRAIDNTILLSILQNYGIHQGKLIRLNKIGNENKNVKSILENSELINDELVIKDLKDKDGKINQEIYTQFRQIVLNVATSIKGNISEEDKNMAGVNLLTRFFMSLRTFLPAMAKERFQGINFNQTTKEVTIGRYSALFQNIFSNLGEKEKEYLSNRKEGEANNNLAMLGYISSNFAKQIGNFAYIMLTYGIPQVVSFGGFNKLELSKFSREIAISESRSKAIFENFKAKFPNTKEIQDLTYEEFIHYKLQQIKTMSVEIVMWGMLLTMLHGLKNLDLDDDDEADYKDNKALRFVYKQILGSYREMSTFINPTEWTNTIQTLSPLIRLINDFFKLLGNGWDESTDLLFGEDEKKDRTPIGYYSVKMIPYVSAMSRQMEWFEQDKEVYWK